MKRTGIALAVAILTLPLAVQAGGTRVWELAGAEELEMGKTDETAVTSRGEVVLGSAARPVDLEDVGLVWSAAADGDDIYLGTGYEGEIYRVRGGAAERIATTGQLVVTEIGRAHV